MAVVVHVFGHNLAMGNAGFCFPCLLCCPFCVGEYDDRSEVAVQAHSATLQFCGKRCHALDIGDDRLHPVEFFSCDADKLPYDVCGLRPLCPFCDGSEKLMNLVLINIFEVAVVRRL